VPLDVIRRQAEEDVRADMIGAAVTDGANPQVESLQAPEGSLHLS
jgi:hypothetical protein